jgi:AraC-like DNA-binding protein
LRAADLAGVSRHRRAPLHGVAAAPVGGNTLYPLHPHLCPVDAHLGNAQLGPDEIADAANLSRASLYRLFAAEGGIRAVLLKRRLDEALRLMLEDNKDEHSLKKIVKCCGFGGTSQFSRAFRARFGVPPRQYRSLVRQQDLDWHEARLMADGFDQGSMLWRHQGLIGSKPSSAD